MKILDFSSLRATCANCSINALCLPHGISKADMEKLDAMVRKSKPIAKGAVLFRAGEPLDSLYLVRSGSLKVQLQTESGDEQIIGFFLPGELMGLDALGTHHHTCTAKALEISSICNLPYDELSDICSHVPALHESLMRLIGMEITAEQELLLSINQRQALGRVAAFLLALSHRFQRLHYSPREFRLTMSRYELGNYLGLTIETVSRAVSRLQQDGLIKVDRRSIRILNPEGLQEICQGEPVAVSLHRCSG
ncbi:MAG: hypothetical protein A3H91_16445 [Gammaproteobacteria bacterium RIFCSPLOWO2_02_FULL_61_13]|nr:MAG: hypothetical protein A3H91_16445 [Gammaproteobacteria bacterium RIFCSPLOWO2_02_FULL_61_13]